MLKPLHAADLMKRDVAYVTAEMSLVELADFLDDNRIHGAPVVGRGNQLVGVVSRTDLARAITEGKEAGPRNTWYSMPNDEGGLDETLTDLDEGASPVSDLTVADIMTSKLVTCEPEWTVGRVAQLMLDSGVHRVLVVQKGGVAGIISATDLLRALPTYEKQTSHKG
jgi:CBS domain-containing protein